VQVLPIVTPGNSPGDPAQAAAAVQSWRVSNAMAFDLEPGSYPSVEWVADTANRMRQAGISPGIYGTAEGQSMYAAANPAWRWVANWSAPGGSVLSDGGWNVHQYTDSESVGGLTYDASIVGPGVMGPAQP
jgi:GH25 family lysozyme M1 (1,4-beta-N-acetylmuramidase)